MATKHARADVHAAERDDQCHVRACLRALGGPGWMHRLGPLARYMATQRLIRARGDRGGALACVDVATLRAALEHLLERAPAQAYLLIAVALEDAPAEVVAAELSIAPAQVMREVQGALAALARQYEQIAFAGEVEEPGLYGALRRRVAGREPELRAVR